MNGPARATHRPFRILSLDGGGLLGTWAAAFLTQLEEEAGRPLGQCFDLIAGTSTGGIIAAGLAAGLPARKILDFYCERGPVIFRRPRGLFAGILAPIGRLMPLKSLTSVPLWCPKFCSVPLKKALYDAVGDRRMGDVKSCRLLIPAVNLTNGQTIVFKTPHLPGLSRDRHIKLVDVLLATTAAPTYFKPAHIDSVGHMADGGVWANNPALAATVEAMKIEQTRRPDEPPVLLDSITCLSLGCGESNYSIRPGGFSGLIWWGLGQRLANAIMASQSQGVSFQMNYLLGDRFRRMDFATPDPSWSMDNPSIIRELAGLGKVKGTGQYAQLKDLFLHSSHCAYVPFPPPEG